MMKKYKTKSILPLVLGTALFVGATFIYSPEDARAMPSTGLDKNFIESVFAPQ